MKTIAKKTKKDVQPRPKFSVMAVILLIGLIVYTICLLSPLLYGLVTSLKTNEDYTLNPTGFPNPLSFSNYATAFEGFYVTIYNAVGMRNIYLERMMLNSLLYALGCSFMSVAVPCLAAYVVANYKYKICNVIYVFVIISIILPIVGSLPSELQLARALGLYDNFFGLWIMSGHIRSMYFLILHATFKAFPKDYAEAAKIDGGGPFTVFFRIILPLTKTVFFTIMLIKFIEFWNDYQTALIYMPSNPTLSYGLYLFRFNTNTEYATMPMTLTGCMIVFLPILVIFLCFRNRIIGNLTIGGLKG